MTHRMCYRGTVLRRRFQIVPLLALPIIGLALAGCDIQIPKTDIQVTTDTPGPVADTPAASVPDAPTFSIASPSATVAPSATPTGPEPPTLTPLAGPWTSVWNSADCTWATSQMALDHTLDYQSAENYQAAGNQGMATTYFSIASRWSTSLSEISSICGSPATYPDGADQLQMVEWWGEAYLSHGNDATITSWDEQWMQTYTRLADLYFALPCSDNGGASPTGPSGNCAWQQHRDQWPTNMAA